MRILLVEDDLRLAETLAEALSDQLYTVDIAANGLLAWDYVKNLDYDLVLLDMVVTFNPRQVLPWFQRTIHKNVFFRKNLATLTQSLSIFQTVGGQTSIPKPVGWY